MWRLMWQLLPEINFSQIEHNEPFDLLCLGGYIAESSSFNICLPLWTLLMWSSIRGSLMRPPSYLVVQPSAGQRIVARAPQNWGSLSRGRSGAKSTWAGTNASAVCWFETEFWNKVQKKKLWVKVTLSYSI